MYSNAILLFLLLSILLISLIYQLLTINIELLDGTNNTNQNPITSIKNLTIPDSQSDIIKKYDYISTDIEYHESPEKILMTEKINDPITIKYSDGTSKIFRFGDVAGSAIYYTPNSFKYGAKTYVPTYEDSIYLSKTFNSYSGITDTPNFKPEYYTIINSICKTKNKNECKVSDACILINDTSCVGGDKNGPSLAVDINKYNQDADYYYYKNKCYGEC